MNLASALIKQVLDLQDYETWSYVRQHYLPSEYHVLHTLIDKHAETYHKMPSFEDLKFSIRDSATQEKLYAIEQLSVDADPHMLLQYLKNEFTQKEILIALDDYVSNSVAFESAEESLEHLHDIVVQVEDKVELEDPQESMQRMTLFENDEELGRYLPLGLNTDYDHEIKFSPRDLILVGGRRGSGKSITCANLANNVYNAGKTSVTFTIEMDSRSTLQRNCSIATGIPFARLRTKNLTVTEWEKLAAWWAGRYVDGQKKLEEYKQHRDFERFHQTLAAKDQLDPVRQLDIVYDSGLTISKIRAEMDRKLKSEMDIGVIIVDYINQVKLTNTPGKGGQYEWNTQIEVSKALKSMAQDYEIPVFTPYQTDVTGEARFAKGILDAADAAYALEAWDQEDACITFKCVKMRSASMKSFTSTMDWETLAIGPESAENPDDKKKSENTTGEAIDDL